MIKELARRHRHHWLALPLLGLFLAVLLLPWQNFAQANSFSVVPPAKVIIDQAQATQGVVKITWLKGQAGTYPIKSYSVERSRGKETFKHIGRVESTSLNYVDPEGQTKDIYRVIAEDGHKQSLRSEPSDSIIATPSKAGEFVVISASSTLNSAKNIKNPNELKDKILTLIDLYGKAVHSGQQEVAAGFLTAINEHQNQVLHLMKTLPAKQKVMFSKMCINSQSVLDASLNASPENAQMDGLLVKASCEAIKAAAK